MKLRRRQYGFSMLETLTAIAIVVLIAAMVLGLGKRIRIQAQENLCKSELEILNTAIQYYYERYKEFPFTTTPDPYPAASGGDGYFYQADLDLMLDAQIGTGSIPTTYDDYASSEMLYYFLHEYNVSRNFIETIDRSLITSFDTNGNNRGFWLSTNSTPYPDLQLLRFIDPWGTTLRYTYIVGDAFCLIESAGPDKTWGTADDIKGR